MREVGSRKPKFICRYPCRSVAEIGKSGNLEIEFKVIYQQVAWSFFLRITGAEEGQEVTSKVQAAAYNSDISDLVNIQRNLSIKKGES